MTHEQKRIKNARERLLRSARDLCAFSDEDLKRLIRDHCRIQQQNAAQPYCATSIVFARNYASAVYIFCSEFSRRRTGFQTYDPVSCIFRRNEITAIIRLSDAAPQIFRPDDLLKTEA